MTDRPLRLLRAKDVSEMTGLAKSTIYKYSRNGKFPKSKRLGKNYVVWRSDEIEEWITRQLEEADQAALDNST